MIQNRVLGHGKDECVLGTLYSGSAKFSYFSYVSEILRTVCVFLIRETSPEGKVKRYGNNIHKICKETTDINSGIFRERELCLNAI